VTQVGDSLAVTGAIPELTVVTGRSADRALADIAASAGLRRVDVIAWRDLDDPEAGGSELHASEIAGRWAAAGIDVVFRTSTVRGAPERAERDGYQVVRRGGRLMLFPRVVGRGLAGGFGKADGLVEIWNGMPFFSPIFTRGPRAVFLHHVHDEMWRMTLKPRPLAWLGEAIESRLAPPLYRRTPIVTLSASSREEIVELLGLPAGNVTVVPPGVDRRFSPGGQRSVDPLVVAVGRLVPVKRLGMLVDALQEVRRRHPRLRVVIAGEGYERDTVADQIAAHDAADWISLPGRVDDDELVALYRQAWVVASASAREGWGMTLTEAAACGTPAVASRIAGHRDAVVDGHSGMLFDDEKGLVDHLDRLLADPLLRHRLSRGALAQVSRHTWDHTARATLAVLAADAIRRRHTTP
jgi:glycosyltransferase involved in cell wall biosynthesis